MIVSMSPKRAAVLDEIVNRQLSSHFTRKDFHKSYSVIDPEASEKRVDSIFYGHYAKFCVRDTKAGTYIKLPGIFDPSKYTYTDRFINAYNSAPDIFEFDEWYACAEKFGYTEPGAKKCLYKYANLVFKKLAGGRWKKMQKCIIPYKAEHEASSPHHFVLTPNSNLSDFTTEQIEAELERRKRPLGMHKEQDMAYCVMIHKAPLYEIMPNDRFPLVFRIANGNGGIRWFVDADGFDEHGNQIMFPDADSALAAATKLLS